MSAPEFATETGKANLQVQAWLTEISAARNREKEWRKEGERILEIYDGCKKSEIPFNILYSNTETLLPALFSNTPRPVVQRRFKDADPLGKASAHAGQRVLEFLLDTNSEEYDVFQSVVEDAVLDGLLPGRGVTRIKYDAETVEVEGGHKALRWETVCLESVKWDRIVIAYSRKWVKTPWIAIAHDVDFKEAQRLFGDVATKLKYTDGPGGSGAADDPQQQKLFDDDSGESVIKTCRVWEIWDRFGGKKVRFVAEGYQEGYLKVDNDPLGLTGFFPFPKPLMFLRKSNDQMPTALYALYENQALELNRVTLRINRIIEACKVRGIYDSTIAELDQMFEMDDNKLIPTKESANFQERPMDKAIWMMPLEKLVAVLQQLYLARQQIKQVIYEITGISDILRGSSVASETATAQEIKNQWGTLRLKRMQKEVQRYTRDILRIMLEISGKRFGEQTLKAMTGLPYPTGMEAQQAQMMAQAAQAMGTPAPPEATQIMSAPSWPAVMNMLRNDTQRMYRIDIETNSTIDLEATEDQKNIAEVMTAISQFIQGVGPMIESGVMPFQVAQAMLLGIVRRYRFGPEVEDHIQQMKPPEPKEDKGEQIKLQVAQVEAQNRQEEMKMEMSLKQQEHQMRLEELAAKKEYNQLMAQLKIIEAKNKIRTAMAMSQIPAQPKAEPQGKEPKNAGV